MRNVSHVQTGAVSPNLVTAGFRPVLINAQVRLLKTIQQKALDSDFTVRVFFFFFGFGSSDN